MSPERGHTLTAQPEGERVHHPLFPGGAVSDDDSDDDLQVRPVTMWCDTTRHAGCCTAAPPRCGRRGLGHVAHHVLDVVSRSSMAILTTGTWANLE
jgi:hypothetical protein